MLLLSAATCTASAQDDGTTTILDLIGENGNFTIISGFFNNSSLNTTLAGEEPYTVFVPTDAAFANVSEDTLEALKEDPAALEQVLLYHVANGTLMAEDLANVSNVTTLQGSELPVNVTEEGVFIGEAEVLQANLTADNGVIHVIDAVLIPPEAPPEEKDIIETATADGNFTTLLAAIGAANLTDTLKGEGPYTVFAPTDDAFDALPEGTIEALLNDTDRLTDILLYHVAGEKLMAEDVVNMTNITTLQGSDLPVNVTEEGVFVGNAKITVQDVNASNGVIHVIDAVLIPPEAPPEEKDIIETATADGNFTTLLAAVEAANLTDTLKGEGPYTVFAPTNEAFNALPEGTVEALLNDTEKLTNILLYHVAAEKLMAEDVVNMTNITTVQGSKLPVNVTEEGVFVGNAKIIVQDVNSSNGVIHAIDAVLIPPEEEKQNMTVLYNDTVNLTEGNVIFRPDAEKNYTIDNLTDFGALYATGLNFNAALAQNMTGNVTDMTNVSFVLKSIEGVENDNTTGEMWFIYINGEPAEENLGMNPVSDGDKLSFWYTTEDGGEAAIENATYVANITIAVEEGMEPEPEQNLTVLYNDTVNLAEGNFTFMPVNATQAYTIGNFTDFGALYATGLDLKASLMQNMTEEDMAGNETEDMNGNETEDMNGNETEDMNGNETEDMNGNETEGMTDNMTNVSLVLEGIEGIENNNTTGEMWFLYINGEPAEADFGMNTVSDGDKLSFWYTTEEGGEALIENATNVVNITVSEMMARETIIEAAQNQTTLTTFINATEAANLTETLNGTGPYTVFIPSNEAFDELPEETRNELMNNTTLLRDVLSYHVLSGKYTREQLASMNTVDNIQGNALQINMVGDNITIQNATITQIIIVNNGVICIIDKVLIPPDSGLPSDGDQTDGNQTDGNQTDGNQTEDLAGDWYFFSIPFEANNTSVDYLLSDVNYSSLIYYNASTKLFEDVSNIEPLKGYWINVPNGTEFNAEEQFASVEKKLVTVPPSLQTYPGWNALGSPVNETVTAQTAFASLNNSYTKVVGPWVPGNNTTGYYQYVGYNDLNGTLGENQLGADEFEVEPYQGYWVFVREESLYA